MLQVRCAALGCTDHIAGCAADLQLAAVWLSGQPSLHLSLTDVRAREYYTPHTCTRTHTRTHSPTPLHPAAGAD